MEERESITRGGPPYHALFEHEDGSWYMLWMTQSEPRTGRGHPWHIHVMFDKQGAARPVLESRWFENPYGTHNWDFDSLDETVRAFFEERYLPRLKHGYRVKSGHLDESWPVRLDDS